MSSVPRALTLGLLLLSNIAVNAGVLPQQTAAPSLNQRDQFAGQAGGPPQAGNRPATTAPQPGNNPATTAVHPVCTPQADDTQKKLISCFCSDAPSTLFPLSTNPAGIKGCDYTAVPTGAAASAPPKPTTTITDINGVVQACTSANWDGPSTSCIGSSSIISTVSSIAAAQASQVAAQQQAGHDIVWDNYQNCTLDTAGAVNYVEVALPNWQGGAFTQSSAQDQLFAAINHNSACASGFQANTWKHWFNGTRSDTLIATWQSSTVCTEWQVTQVIKAATGGKFATACVQDPSTGHWGQEGGEGEQEKPDGVENQPGEPVKPDGPEGGEGGEIGAAGGARGGVVAEPEPIE